MSERVAPRSHGVRGDQEAKEVAEEKEKKQEEEREDEQGAEEREGRQRVDDGGGMESSAATRRVRLGRELRGRRSPRY